MIISHIHHIIIIERVAERLEREQDQAAKDEQSAKERDENIRRVREEKAAQRAATQAEKQAANDAAIEDAKYKGAKFVDTSMPTYQSMTVYVLEEDVGGSVIRCHDMTNALAQGAMKILCRPICTRLIRMMTLK